MREELINDKNVVTPKVRVKQFLKKIAKNNTYIMFILLFIVSVLASSDFMKASNLMNIGRQYAALTFVCMGLLFVILTGGIDLSVGSIIALGSVMTGVCLSSWGFNVVETMAFVVMLGCVAGSISGILVSYFRFAPFIATLAMMTIARGLAFMISQGAPIRTPPGTIGALGTAKLFGVFPMLIVMSIALIVLFWFIQSYTTYGRLVMAIGSNETAVRLSGIRVQIYKTSVYAICGGLSAFAGVLIASRSAIGSPLVGVGTELDAIAACVIGGASLTGGEGTAVKTVMGVLILAMIGNVMNLLAIPSYPQDVIKGAIIIAAVMLQTVTNSKKASS